MRRAYLQQIGIDSELSYLRRIGHGCTTVVKTAPASPTMVESVAVAPAVAVDVPAAVSTELSKEELAKMTKDERTAYYKERRPAAKAKAKAKPDDEAGGVSKADLRRQRAEKQEADRRRKEDAINKASNDAEALEELKLQGLTEDQAREVLAEMAKEKVAADADADEDEDDEDESLLASVRRWMSECEQATTDETTLSDFNLKVRFQGHVDSTPPDHLGAILEVVAAQACSDSSFVAAAKQPGNVAKKMGPTLCRWAHLLGALYKKCDALDAADSVVSSLVKGVTDATQGVAQATRDCVVVGLLMAIRDEVDVADEDLLVGCRRQESDSKVWTGFVSFLEEAVEGSDEEDDQDDSEDE